MKEIAVFIADDHPMVRDAIKNVFRHKHHINFSGEANDGYELMELVKKSIPEVAIIDLEMPKMDGYDTISKLHAIHPEIKTIAFSGFLDSVSQQRAIDLGATATICKSEPINVFMDAFKAVIDGKGFHSTVSTNLPVEQLKKDKQSKLTMREKQILSLIAKGKTSKEIGDTYNISPWTVNKHRSNIKEKLEIKTLAEMIRYAIHIEEASD